MHTWLNGGQNICVFQIGAGRVIGEVAALPGSGFVDGAPATHLAITEEYAGAIFPDLERVFSLNVFLAHFSICQLKMTGKPVDIKIVEIERRTFQAVATVARAVIAEGFVAGEAVWRDMYSHEVSLFRERGYDT